MRRTGAFGTAGAISSAREFDVDNLGLSFYDELPYGDISIPEFENLARARLKVLSVLDRVSNPERRVGRDIEKTGEDKAITELKQRNLYLNYPTLDEAKREFFDAKEEFIKSDTIGHFILRLGFCKTRDARQWFTKQEARLFSMRLKLLKDVARTRFYEETGNAHTQYTGNVKEFQEATPAAKIFGGGTNSVSYETDFYEIPFTLVNPFWIAKRRLVLRKGMAYVPESMILELVVDKFQDRIKEDLQRTFEGLEPVMRDKRIAPFIKTLQENGQNLFFANASTAQVGPTEKLSLSNFEFMLKKSFPPCMRWAVQAQRDQKKRLKHQGKLQLRPFLREAGFDLKESLTWWRQEVTRDPEVDEGKFDKTFVYDIEHAYAKKGHMKGQNAFGCASILGYPLATQGQTHGCPFKVMDKDMMGKALLHWEVAPTDIEDIVKKASGKHYQLACKEFFCKTHAGHSGEGIGNHPNHFFNESVRHYKAKSEGAEGAETTGAASSSSSSSSTAKQGDAAANNNAVIHQPMDVS